MVQAQRVRYTPRRPEQGLDKTKMKRCVSCKNRFDGKDWTCPACGFAPGTVAGVPSFVAAAGVAEPPEFDQTTYDRMMWVESQSFYFLARRAIIAWTLERFFGRFGAYYDFGMGTGFMLSHVREHWRGADLYGSDLSTDSLLTVSKRVKDATLFHADADHIPFEERFDVIGAYDVIEHIDDDVAALKALYRTLKPGGGLLVTVPQHMAFWCVLDVKTGHRRRYVGDELARKVRAAGFDVLMDTSYMASLFLPQYVSRRWLSQAANSEPEMEHNLPVFINQALKAVLAAELASIRMGVRYPFGGMRLVAARRPV